MRHILIFVTLLTTFHVAAETIKPFSSDGCSLFPDGTFKQRELWLSCCTAHDYAYWKGGTYVERKFADKQLQQCVMDIGEMEVAKVMYIGVRFGGSPYFPTWYRWGYGWPYMRGYQQLSVEELQQIKDVEVKQTATR